MPTPKSSLDHQFVISEHLINKKRECDIHFHKGKKGLHELQTSVLGPNGYGEILTQEIRVHFGTSAAIRRFDSSQHEIHPDKYGEFVAIMEEHQRNFTLYLSHLETHDRIRKGDSVKFGKSTKKLLSTKLKESKLEECKIPQAELERRKKIADEEEASQRYAEYRKAGYIMAASVGAQVVASILIPGSPGASVGKLVTEAASRIATGAAVSATANGAAATTDDFVRGKYSFQSSADAVTKGAVTGAITGLGSEVYRGGVEGYHRWSHPISVDGGNVSKTFMPEAKASFAHAPAVSAPSSVDPFVVIPPAVSEKSKQVEGSDSEVSISMVTHSMGFSIKRSASETLLEMLDQAHQDAPNHQEDVEGFADDDVLDEEALMHIFQHYEPTDKKGNEGEEETALDGIVLGLSQTVTFFKPVDQEREPGKTYENKY